MMSSITTALITVGILAVILFVLFAVPKIQESRKKAANASQKAKEVAGEKVS